MTLRGSPFEVGQPETCKGNDIFCRSDLALIDRFCHEVFVVKE